MSSKAIPEGRNAAPIPPYSEISSKQYNKITLKRKALKLLENHVATLSLVLFIVGLGWLLVLPHDEYSHDTYISENALLPGQTNNFFGENEVNVARHYAQVLESLRTNPIKEKASFVERELRSFGYITATQDFEIPLSYNKVVNGTNAFGILKAPRSDNTEAMVLTASWDSQEANQDNINGVSMLLSLAKFLKKFTFWSKDIVVVIADKNTAGIQAWLDAYHGVPKHDDEQIFVRSGAIQGALNLDFPGTGSYSSLGIFFEGLNGQLPNLDLINTVVQICRYEGISVTLHKPASKLDIYAPRSYTKSLHTMLTTMKYQASCHPSGVHGLFHRYKIDAISLHGVSGSGRFGFQYQKIGILIESTLRSINNLLEHFHQSFFFYLLPDASRYVSIALYIPPVICIAVGLLLISLKLWFSFDDSVAEVELVEDVNHEGKDVKSIKTSVAYTQHSIPLQTSIIVIGLSILGCVLLFSLNLLIVHPITEEISLPLSGIFAFGFPLFISSAVRQRAEFTPYNLQVLRCFALAWTAVTLVGLAALNYSFAVFMGILVFLPYALIQPRSHVLARALQFILTTAISPPSLLLLCSFVYGQGVVELYEYLKYDFVVLFGWFLPLVYLVYWPINVTYSVLAWTSNKETQPSQ
ncbi:Gaa1-domain-containing protein [Basidiobolus meristosporus CBS 931.73]|uniref:Gaa1-domain-containing protein n=1 Tax=Basidiobolus meristosporus CBS 931.73 TaxID=1314790 RepID=A0A1Y1Z542_9FUNG|nr:Gaa1-domain-containing protein [Basidiobolus meristosporus CBS 931.73]|eukprot:ORY05097.1 Gaa1-domain-containing protein [Basidiobolus meristosporus CBS 931.73]